LPETDKPPSLSPGLKPLRQRTLHGVTPLAGAFSSRGKRRAALLLAA